ncbi:MAG: endolytic transglycosylase MltG [Polyangiales bacterium]
MARTRSKTERKRQRGSGSRARRWRLLGRIALALLTLAALLSLAALGYLLMSYPSEPGPGHGRVVSIELAPGTSLDRAASDLSHAGALREPRLFALYARLLGARTRLRTGEVLLDDSMSPRDLLRRIALGLGTAPLRVVIPEGFSRYDIAQRLDRWGVCSRADFLAATEDAALLHELGIAGPSAEGLLFPDTYVLREQTDSATVVRRLVRNARRRIAPILAERQASVDALRQELGYGERELLTLASIVEREAAAQSEQPIIAGVFLNRLRDPGFSPRRLQADPTVAYGCEVAPLLPSCASFDGHLVTHAMLSDPDNPYNTYRLEGLPPGPIANPGLGALRAVLDPARHEYFYFVAKGGGLHTFSHSLEDHNAAVDQLRKR